MEYKYKSVYSGPGTIQVSYSFKLYGSMGVSGGSGYASVVSTIGVWDSTGSNIGYKTIFSNILTSGSQSFDGSTPYTGSYSLSVSGYQTYTVRWTVDIYSQDHGNTDFYNPFWFENTMTIVTPSGGAPIG
ncbi:MAG TPA: hypothetical protein VGR56_05110 [Nitrososphaerales archaeon]|nr:hypothetical protein [Nitrososphaerales archaeon]